MATRGEASAALALAVMEKYPYVRFKKRENCLGPGKCTLSSAFQEYGILKFDCHQLKRSDLNNYVVKLRNLLLEVLRVHRSRFTQRALRWQSVRSLMLF